MAFTHLVLRRHGHWPALVAFGEPRAAASLVVALCKAALAVMLGVGVDNVAGRPLDVSGVALRLQLRALRAQLGPQHGCHVARGGARGVQHDWIWTLLRPRAGWTCG